MGVNVCNGYDTREGVPSKTSNDPPGFFVSPPTLPVFRIPCTRCTL